MNVDAESFVCFYALVSVVGFVEPQRNGVGILNAIVRYSELGLPSTCAPTKTVGKGFNQN